jgi:YihY family inner membrane protein
VPVVARDPWVWPRRLLRFAGRVAGSFLANRGLLLAGGVGYNALLSLVPFLAVVVSLLSLVLDEERILAVLRAEVAELVPQYADTIVGAARTFIEARGPTGVITAVALVFFSSIAFRMLEEAVAGIFHTSVDGARRRVWVSAVLPYLLIVLAVAALFALTVATYALDALGERSVRIFGVGRSLAMPVAWILGVLNFVGLVVAFAAIYHVLPVVRISIRRALVGGLTAAVLWRAVARFLVYFFTNVSMANVIYGSLASAVITLLYLEIASIILLLGAQVIAELQASAAAGLPWYERPPRGISRRGPEE